MITRAELVTASLNLRGVPYLWGAKGLVFYTGQPTPAFALDCSGAVTYAIKQVAGVDLTRTHNTDKLWNELPSIEVPQLGDIALYGGNRPDDVSHVEMIVAIDPDSKLYVVGGASGGTPQTLTLDIAKAARAMYKVKKSHLYRTDFRGFRSVAPLLTRPA